MSVVQDVVGWLMFAGLMVMFAGLVFAPFWARSKR